MLTTVFKASESIRCVDMTSLCVSNPQPIVSQPLGSSPIYGVIECCVQDTMCWVLCLRVSGAVLMSTASSDPSSVFWRIREYFLTFFCWIVQVPCMLSKCRGVKSAHLMAHLCSVICGNIFRLVWPIIGVEMLYVLGTMTMHMNNNLMLHLSKEMKFLLLVFTNK